MAKDPIQSTGPDKKGPNENKRVPNPDEFKKASDQGPQEDNQYLGFHFESKKDYMTFKTKFLAQMANMMIRQIKKDNERMIEALKKMKEQ